MRTLVVYYSKTGTTQKVAQALIEGKDCDADELKYDEKTKEIRHLYDPSDYDRVVLLAPVWAFALAEPMKKYVVNQKSKIKEYDLIVTCGGLGLRGCIKNCVSAIGRPPENAVKLRSKYVKEGNFDLSKIKI